MKRGKIDTGDSDRQGNGGQGNSSRQEWTDAYF